ncbi:MAG: phenylalanine--tRNA ligase subunit alpha [Patescibacteria group bacterium]|nr:phenylalanine--tRNA ligase subunit alpha [Patescibacteria group bacterium]
MAKVASLDDLQELIKTAEQKISLSSNLKELNDYKLEYITGKKSLLNRLTQGLKNLTESEKKSYGQEINAAKETLNSAIKGAEERIHRNYDEEGEWFDVSLPVPKAPIGHMAPDTQVIRQMNAFFTYHGYSVAEGPEIETDEYNFEKTNLPKDHPARDLQDTIYIESPEVLLRTHTSSVETRILSSHKPPLRFVVPGVSFRNEIINQSNHAIFYQYQGVLVDKDVSLANLKATLNEFAKFLYGDKVKTRFRTKYYPEVEPGAGMDILCRFCSGTGCRICKDRGWIEILGSGIIHRNLLAKSGIDWKVWSGFAFGMGLDRIIMTKFGITDIRDLHSGNLVFTQ